MATRPGGLASIAGIVWHPRSTFQTVLAQPRWLGLLIALTLATAAARGLALSAAVGRQALVDEWERTATAFGADIDDRRYADLQAWSRYAPAYGVGEAIVTGPVFNLAVAGLLAAVFRRAPRSRPFGRLWAVVVHAGVVLAGRQVVAAPLVYVRETTASASSLAAWLPIFSDGSAAARFLGAIDAFVVWWLLVLAIGMGTLLDRPALRLAWTFLAVYLGLALILALAVAALSIQP